MDWLRLLDEHECTMQVGGSDQMGNIRMGKELVHRVRHGSEIYGFTVPLVTTDKGAKIGKSAGGDAIWLSAHKTSPFDLYQYFVRVADKDVERLLKLFTFMPLNEVDDLVRKHMSSPEKLRAQKRLAEHVTKLVHGETAVKEAQAATRVLYEGDMQALGELSLAQVRSVFSSNAAFVRLLFEAGMTMLDLSMKAGCFRTEKDAARVIGAGGFYVNQMKVSNTEEIVNPEMHFLPNDSMLLRVGKRNYFIVEWML